VNLLFFSTNSDYGTGKVGGAETSLRLIAEKFATLGESVFYVTMSGNKIPGFTNRTINGVRVYFIKPLYWPTLSGKFFINERSQFEWWQLRHYLRNFISKHNIDIIHTYSIFPDTYNIVSLREKYELPIKIIPRIAGFYWRKQCNANPNLKDQIESTLNKVDSLNFLSESLRKLFFAEIEKINCSVSNNYFIQDIGYNSSNFQKQWKKPNKTNIRITMVGRLSHPKRQDLLIQALSHIDSKNFELYLIGEGVNKSYLKKISEEYSLGSKVFFIGHIDQDAIQDYLINSDLFCFATEYEGVPKSLLEAMAIGLPVLASDVNPITDIITEGVNGFLVPNDSKCWAVKIQDLLNTSNSRLEKISNKARYTVKDKYNPDTNIRKYKKYFAQVLKD